LTLCPDKGRTVQLFFGGTLSWCHCPKPLGGFLLVLCSKSSVHCSTLEDHEANHISSGLRLMGLPEELAGESAKAQPNSACHRGPGLVQCGRGALWQAWASENKLLTSAGSDLEPSFTLLNSLCRWWVEEYGKLYHSRAPLGKEESSR
jgi:hypothetical protein